MKKFIEINGDAGKNVYERLNAISPPMARQMVGSFGDAGAPQQVHVPTFTRFRCCRVLPAG